MKDKCRDSSLCGSRGHIEDSFECDQDIESIVPIARSSWDAMYNPPVIGARATRSVCNYWLREFSSPIVISSSSTSRVQLNSINVDSQSINTMGSDCILVEKEPEVIVIEDDDENVESGTQAAVKTQENELKSETQTTRPIRKDKVVVQKPPDGFFERITNPFRSLRFAFSSRPPPTPAQVEALQRGIVAAATPERRRNSIYNSNTYNPNKVKPSPGKRMVILDGSNIAYAHSCNKHFSVNGINIALEYFERMGHEVKAVVPQHRLRKSASSDPGLLEMLHRSGKIVLTPCKNLMGKSTASYDDRFILQLAVEFDAAVVSNDNFNDLITESSAFKKVIESRVIGYTWCKDMFMLPKDPYGRDGPNLSVILNRT